MNLLKALRFFLYPLYFLSFLIPKKNNIWVFGSHQNRFSENSKYLFLYTSKYHKDIKSIWITGDKKLSKKLQEDGYISYSRWSFKGLYFSLRAKQYFYNVYSDDINFYTSGNTTLINLWHGIPLKQIEFDIKKGALKRIFNSPLSFIYAFFKPYLFISPDYVLSTSKITSKIYASALRVKESQCLELGYPRTDIFYTNRCDSIDDNITFFYKKMQNLKDIHNHKIIIYMPTWRSNKTDFLTKALPDLVKLNTALTTNKITLFIKLHPNEINLQNNLSNILFIHPKTDIYELLPLTEFLITDYSSIYFDYLLLDKEIIFYPFDLENYLNDERELYFDYHDKTPGTKVYNFEELLLVLSNLNSLDFKDSRESIRNEFWSYQDANASMRIANYFKDKIL